MLTLLIVAAFSITATAAAGLWLHLQRSSEWREREQHLLRLMREQETAREGLELANRELEQRARQLARSNAELERFAHVASHDLKEPVRTVISYTQLLAKKYSGALDAQAQEYIRDAAEAARSIRSRIESLLDYAIAGKAGEEYVRTDCRAAVDKALANLRPAIAESQATIFCEALPTVMAHPPELTLLFQNLLDNAIKFRGSRVPDIRVTAQRGENRAEWLIVVSDNGIGIDPKLAEKSFGLFQRLRPQDAQPGLGMGLPLCKKIVEGHGGRIWHEPNDGGGSRFLFTLPAPAN